MTRKIHSEIVRFKEMKRLEEDLSSDIDDIDSDSSSDVDDSISDMTRSQIKSLIQQELKSSESSEDKSVLSVQSSDKKTDRNSSSNPPPIPRKNPEIRLPKRKHKRSHDNIKSPSETDFESLYQPKYEVLEPVNIYSKSKKNLISFDDNRVVSLLKKYENEFCIITPTINSLYMTTDMNMRRCLDFIKKLNERDYLYFPVYLSDKNSDLIYDILFIVFPVPVKNRDQSHSFMNLFDLMIELSDKKMFTISNMIFKDDSFTMRKKDKFYFLQPKTKRDLILDLCRVNNDKVYENSELLTNPPCLDKNEYTDRYINKNELCLFFSLK